MSFDISDEISQFFAGLADFATTVQRRLGWFLGIAIGLSIAVAVSLYSSESATWWNLIKCGSVLLPALIWCLVWLLLSQIREAPELVSTLAAREDLSFTNLRARVADRKPGLISLFSTIRELRDNEAYDSISEAIGSITLLANPLFIIVAFAMLVVLFILMLIAPFVLFF